MIVIIYPSPTMPWALQLLFLLYLSFKNLTIALEVGIVSLPPFCRWSNWGLAKLIHLSMFTQLRIRTLIWFCYSTNWFLFLYLPPCSFLPFSVPSFYPFPSLLSIIVCVCVCVCVWVCVICQALCTGLEIVRRARLGKTFEKLTVYWRQRHKLTNAMPETMLG